MTKRILYGAILIAATAGLLWLDWRLGRQQWPGWPLAAAALVLIPPAMGELAAMARSAGAEMLTVSSLVGAAVLATAPFWWQFPQASGVVGQDLLVVLGFVVLLAFAEQMVRHRTRDALRRIAVTLLGVLYLGVGAGMMLSIRMRYGVQTLVLFLAAVKFTDVGAYFAGSAAGKHKMIPWLSPGKSWEGLAGGLVLGTGVCVLSAWLLGGPLNLWQAAVLGVVSGLAGQFADLCESLLKRSVGVKDSGAVLPGFGGVLDILDSLLLAAPVALLLLVALLG